MDTTTSRPPAEARGMSEDGTDWAGLRVRDGVGMDPGPIRDMLRAPDSRSGDEAYWRIEGTAFYSHELEEASEPLTQILIDAVCDGDGTPLGLMFATDMLVEITCGYTSPHEEEAGSAGLADRCRAIVRHRLSRLYRLVVALGRCPRHARQPRRRRAGRYSGH